MDNVVTPRSAPEERVHQFMLDYDERWRRTAPAFADRDGDDAVDPFALWNQLAGELAELHYLDPATAELAGAFSTPPEYGPQSETLVGSQIEGEYAYVQTRGGPPLSKLHEYTLTEHAGQWKIVGIDDHYADPTEPFLDAATAQQRRSACSPTARLESMPRAQAGLDENRNFTEREVEGVEKGTTTAVRVSEVGTLVTTSGVLAALDFGYDNHDARPLARTVEPGSYPVDRVTAASRNAALRVRFSEQKPVAWYPASVAAGGHVFGVDAGNACIVDYPAYSAMSRRAKATQYRRFTTAQRPAALEVPLGGADVGVVAESGYGDGTYPAYWGLDADGRTAQLVIEFLVLTTRDDDGNFRHR